MVENQVPMKFPEAVATLTGDGGKASSYVWREYISHQKLLKLTMSWPNAWFLPQTYLPLVFPILFTSTIYPITQAKIPPLTCYMQMISNSFCSYLQNIFQIYLCSLSPTANTPVQEGILSHPNYGNGLIDGLSSSLGSILSYILLSKQSKNFGKSENMLLFWLNLLMA